MHHFRGKLFQGDKVCLDPANVYVDCRSTEGDAASGWSGYLLVGSEKDVVSGGNYTLRLEDGRAGELRIDTFAPDDSARFARCSPGWGHLGERLSQPDLARKGCLKGTDVLCALSYFGRSDEKMGLRST